ncbi:MAG TPA: DUF2330 domain-containing protein [Polyangiaceae bacterium]
MRPAFRRWAVVTALGVAATCGVVPRVARACGGFFSRKLVEGERRPSLAYERTLVVFDEKKQREHFVREVVFRAAGGPFGFVVPVPGRPEVAGLKSPFDALEREYPFSEPGLGLSSSVGGGMRGGGVRVLEVKKVGSFRSFVLAADDAHALTDWLEKNGFSTTRESDRWLAHYVRSKFFYVAMRYEPPAREKKGAERTKAETLRISFDTPLAFYPYYEPDPSPGENRDAPRMLEMWFVSTMRVVPVAARSAGGEVSWVRPMATGLEFSGTREGVQATFGEAFELLPSGRLSIQHFIDQKRSRVGYGDVLFVPASVTTPNLESMRRLFPILDPTLEGAEKAP